MVDLAPYELEVAASTSLDTVTGPDAQREDGAYPYPYLHPYPHPYI